MDDVARAACVGKGTLYRRFGDRESLVLALLGEREQAFQEDCCAGRRRSARGADPLDRLHAFGPAYLELLAEIGPLLAAAETHQPQARFDLPPYAAYRLHLRVLLEQAAPATDVEWAAEALMALVSASFVLHLDRRGFDRDRLATGWCRTVDALARR